MLEYVWSGAEKKSHKIFEKRKFQFFYALLGRKERKMKSSSTGKMRMMMTVSIATACIMAAYSARQGYATTTSDWFLSSGVALACGIFVFSFCDFLVVFLPRMDNHRRTACGGLSIVVLALMFYFSTQWTVVAIGGKTAMSTHIQRTVAGADELALKIYRQLTAEKNMAPQLKALAAQYADLATRESAGAFSGMYGEGDVVATLRSTSNLFSNAATTIETVARDGDELYAEFQKFSDKGRKLQADLQGTEVTDGPEIRRLLLQFGSNLSEINRVLVRMRGTSAREFVKTMNSNLGQLALKPQESSNAAQKAAIERLAPAVAAAQKVVGQITSGDPLGEETNQVFAMMEPAEAIWVYAGRVGFAWGAGIALDLIPFIFAFCSLLIAKESQEEREQEEEAEKEERERSRPRRINTDRG